jgi:hypothetical protein
MLEKKMTLNETNVNFSGSIVSALLPKVPGLAAKKCKKKKNAVLYSAADIAAKVFAGNEEYLPNRVGFIYSAAASPSLIDPASLPEDTRRATTWASLGVELSDASCNIAIAPFKDTPAVSVSGDDTLYAGNSVNYASHTGLVSDYGFSTTNGSYAPTIEEIEDTAPNLIYFHQVVLLNCRFVGGSLIYTPFARASLGTAPFTAKPATFDQAVFWEITFK